MTRVIRRAKDDGKPRRPAGYNRFRWGLMLPIIITIFVLTIYPGAYLVWLVGQDWTLTLPGATPKFIGLENFRSIYYMFEFPPALKNTIYFYFLTVPMEFALGLGLALLLNEKFRGRAVVRILLLIPLAIAPAIVGMTWYAIYNPDMGVLNNALSTLSLPTTDWLGYGPIVLPSIAVIDIWITTPFMMIILLAGLQGVDPTLYEAAAVDGMSSWQRFRLVTIPTIKPAILVALLFRSVDNLKTFDIIYTTTLGGPGVSSSVLDFLVYRVGFYTTLELGKAATLAVVLLLLAMGITYIFMRALNIREMLWG